MRSVRVLRGVTRVVLLVGRWAIKVPRVIPGQGMWSWTRGVQANLSEAEWSGFEEWQGRVAPVRWSLLGGLVNVYPRCDPVVGWTREQIEARRLPLGPCDPNPGNVGWLDGELVWVDYDQSWNDCRLPCCRARVEKLCGYSGGCT